MQMETALIAASKSSIQSQHLQPMGWGGNISLTVWAPLLPCLALCCQVPGVEAKAAAKGLLKGLKTTVQRRALQIGSFKGGEITMAGHIPGGESCSSQSEALDQRRPPASKALKGRAGSGGWW